MNANRATGELGSANAEQRSGNFSNGWTAAASGRSYISVDAGADRVKKVERLRERNSSDRARLMSPGGRHSPYGKNLSKVWKSGYAATNPSIDVNEKDAV